MADPPKWGVILRQFYEISLTELRSIWLSDGGFTPAIDAGAALQPGESGLLVRSYAAMAGSSGRGGVSFYQADL